MHHYKILESQDRKLFIAREKELSLADPKEPQLLKMDVYGERVNRRTGESNLIKLRTETLQYLAGELVTYRYSAPGVPTDDPRDE